MSINSSNLNNILLFDDNTDLEDTALKNKRRSQTLKQKTKRSSFDNKNE